MMERSRTSIKEDLSRKYSEIKAKIKESIPSKKEGVLMASFLSTFLYFCAVLVTSDPNPLTMKKSYNQVRIKRAEERKAEKERYTLKVKRLENLSELKESVLRKAEYMDGKAGLTFTEQAELSRKLGYKGMLLEGRINNFELEATDEYFEGVGVYLTVNKDKIKVSEKSLRDYLNNPLNPNTRS